MATTNETGFQMLWPSYGSVEFVDGKGVKEISILLCSSYSYLLYDMIWNSYCQLAVVVGLLTFLVYYFLLLPMNLKRDLCDVGFDYLTDGHYKSPSNRKCNKKELVRQVQRLRKIGNLPPSYPNGWFPLMESDDLKKNEVREVTALGEHFALFRNDRGKVQILDAYCPHLGANMAIGGAVHGNCLECPFHGWRFDGDTGQCSTIPYAEKVPTFIQVKKWPAVEVNSFIFVWYHAENEEPSWYPQDLEPIKSKNWICHGRSEFLIACHIQDVSENGGDIAHLNAIHAPNLLGGHDLRFFERFYLKFMRHMWTGDWQPNATESHMGLMTLNLDTRIFNKFSVGKMNVKVDQVGPAYAELNVNGSWGPMILLQAVTPVEPQLQKVVNRIYAPPMQLITAKLMLYGELIMFERDIMVWNHKKYLSKPQLVKEDKALARHRRWYSQFYSKNSPKFTFRKETTEW
ncbi:hypothetical protein RUM44_001437 [Polyplax serrata]|uniref:cholesterol 7-desaturase n=1 Tax=Polyplax serrata TaxID=468196 RepID=A0ABR1AK29_POLSC